MFLKPAKLGEKEIPESILSEDKKHCKKIGPCGIGKEALYLNSFYLERRYYVPAASVSRVFKRVAMSKGGFTGKRPICHHAVSGGCLRGWEGKTVQL